MSGARRVLLVVALAAIAVVPLRAFGVVGGDSAAGLSVQASLGGCGVSGTGIVCEIQVAFSGVEGADHYTATVTRADGSVQSAGTVGTGEDGGSATIYVPYVGSGTYSVTVSAWGEDDDGDSEPELLERDRAGAGEDRDRGKATAEQVDPEAADEAAEEVSAPEPTEPPEASEPAPPETQTLPECQPEEPPAEAAETASEDTGVEEASAAPPAPPPAPAIECATPSSDANGPCCPPGA